VASVDPLFPVAIVRRLLPLVGGAAGLLFGMVALPCVLRLSTGPWFAAAFATAVMCAWAVERAMSRTERAGLVRTLLFAVGFGLLNVPFAYLAASMVGSDVARAIPLTAVATVVGAPFGAALGLAFGLAVSIPVDHVVVVLREPTPDGLDRCVVVAGLWLALVAALLVAVDPMGEWRHGLPTLAPGIKPVQVQAIRALAAVLAAMGLALAIAAARRRSARKSAGPRRGA
jgi:hypothetical protein